MILSGILFSQDFNFNQSQQQAVYFIDSASLGGEEISAEDFVLARTLGGTLVGATQYDEYGTDLVVMGEDLDIIVDGDTYSVCETTGTCGYPRQGDSIFLSVYDSSSNQEYTPFAFMDNGTSSATAIPQAVIFSTLINEDFILIQVTEDCEGLMGGDALVDECGVCSGSGLNENGCCGDDAKDCEGLCGGDALVDECGICNGGGVQQDCGCGTDGTLDLEDLNNGEGACDCEGNVLDCFDDCGGVLSFSTAIGSIAVRVALPAKSEVVTSSSSTFAV